MRSESGKTFRYIANDREKDVSLRVTSQIKIFGYELNPMVSYSAKKKGRWQLAKLISSEYDNEECPVMYSKHQCVYDEHPTLDLYLYDSLTGTKIGTIDVSNRNFAKGNFNLKSVIRQIEHRQDYTEKEKKTFEKLKKRGKKNNKRSRQNREIVEGELPVRSEHVLEKEARKECVHIQEYVNVQDLSNVNMFSYRRYLSKQRVKKNFDMDWEINEEQEEEEMETLDSEKEVRPFVLAGNDFHCQISANERRKIMGRKERKRVATRMMDIGEEFDLIDVVEEDFLEKKEDKEDVPEDKLVEVIIDLQKDVFLEQMENIAAFCKCWRSGGKPWTILVDLDQFEESRRKSFIVLKQSVWKSEDVISVRVILNLDNDGLEETEVVNMNFRSIRELVSFVQSRLKSETEQKMPLQNNVVMLDGFIEGSILHKVKLIDQQNNLYLYHKEWKSCQLKVEDLKVNVYEDDTHFDYTIDECIVCGSMTPDDEMTIIRNCDHHVCDKCLSDDIKHGLLNNDPDLLCPYEGCSTYLEAPTILSFVRGTMYKHRIDKMETVIIDKSGRPCFWCGTVLLEEAERDLKSSKKPVEYVCTCGRSICSDCGQLQHCPSSCHEMREHISRVVEGPKKEIIPKSKVSPTSSWANCQSCNLYIYPNDLSKVVVTTCGERFCKNCLPRYNIHIESCKLCLENVATFPYSTQVIPFQNPRSRKLKMYNQSVYLGLLQRPNNTNGFKEDICRIMSWTGILQTRSQSANELTAKYSEILRILESMFVAAYNSHRKSNPKKLNLLKISADHLLFFVHRIHRLKDEIHKLMKERRSKVTDEAISQKYTMLEEDINNSKLYIGKIMALLKL